MLDKFIFDEDIKRVFNCLTNTQIITQCLLKDFISDIKILNEPKRKDRLLLENTSNLNNNSKNSSQNMISLNNLASRTNTSIHPMAINNSFLYLNSSFKSANYEKLEGSLIEFKWKKNIFLLLLIAKINDSEKFSKSIEVECIEMNHFENAFNFEITLYWNTSLLQTILVMKIKTKNKIIQEIINREFNENERKMIFDRLNGYLANDLTNIENCKTTLIFANMRDISLYLSDITKIIKFSPNMENKRFEVYSSSLISSGQNCRVYDLETNTLWQEYIFSGYFVEKNVRTQIRWQKRENNKTFCIYRISIIYLEENISLLIFKNSFTTHVTPQYLSDINYRKTGLFKELREFFDKKNKKSGLFGNHIPLNKSLMKMEIALKNFQDKEDENRNDLYMFIHNNSLIKNLDINELEKEQDSHFNSLMQGSYLDNKDGGNLFTDSMQNISGIENINSGFLFGIDEEKNNL